jgi:hypothetical protein
VGKLGTRILIICMQKAHGIDLAARLSIANPLDLKWSLCAAKLQHETVLLWLIESPSYHTAKC